MRSRLQLLGGLGLLLLIVLASYFLLLQALGLLRQLDPNVAAAIIAALAAATAAVYSQRLSRAREIEESHRPQKIGVYDVFMDIVDKFVEQAREGSSAGVAEATLTPEVASMFAKFRRGLLIWASPQVIKTFQRFQVVAAQAATPDERRDV
jgi:hypothetical protein